MNLDKLLREIDEKCDKLEKKIESKSGKAKILVMVPRVENKHVKRKQLTAKNASK